MFSLRTKITNLESHILCRYQMQNRHIPSVPLWTAFAKFSVQHNQSTSDTKPKNSKCSVRKYTLESSVLHHDFESDRKHVSPERPRQGLNPSIKRSAPPVDIKYRTRQSRVIQKWTKPTNFRVLHHQSTSSTEYMNPNICVNTSDDPTGCYKCGISKNSVFAL